jgi:hypothetical protein
MEKDQERLQESSMVAGLTMRELREQRERFLTADQLRKMRSHELARLDPAKVDESLRALLIDRLILFGELEAAVQGFEKTGFSTTVADIWRVCVEAVARSQNRDLLLRLLNIESPLLAPKAVPISAQLLLADKSALELIENAALEGLKHPDKDQSVDLGYALMEGQWPALGILITRGLLMFKSIFDSHMLFEVLLETRDRLNLEPTDPIQIAFDQRLEESIEAYGDSEVLREAHERLEIKNRELSEARSKLAMVEAELEKKEREDKPVKTVTTVPLEASLSEKLPAIAEESATRELRRSVALLKEELKERHTERNQLRQELNATLKDLEELRQKQTGPNQPEEPGNETENEDNFLEEPGPIGTQPLRVPQFSARFLESLDQSPLSVSRHAMSLIGRLAAGESSAFVGIKRLQSNREIVRQRLSDYRLLFRLHPKTIELLALIPRRDLERKIRSLAAT